MAKQEILISDLSGETLPAEDAVKVVILTMNGKRYELDAGIGEVQNLVEHGREAKRRGRPKKS